MWIILNHSSAHALDHFARHDGVGWDDCVYVFFALEYKRHLIIIGSTSEYIKQRAHITRIECVLHAGIVHHNSNMDLAVLDELCATMERVDADLYSGDKVKEIRSSMINRKNPLSHEQVSEINKRLARLQLTSESISNQLRFLSMKCNDARTRAY